MNKRQIADRVQYGVIAVQIFAMAILAWSGVLGVQLAIDSSVPGGLAVILIAAIGLALTGWRVNFKWKQLHGRL